MRVTFVLRSLDHSGGNRMVAMHAAGLRERGHVVEVVSSWDPPHGSRLSGWVRSSLGLAAMQPDPPSPSHLDSHGIVPRLTAEPGRLQPHEVPDADVVVATWWETAEWVQRLAPAKGARAYFVQHYEAFDYMPRQRVDATYRAPLHRIAVAPWLVHKLREDFGDNDVDLVPNAVDATRFDATPRGPQARPTVGFVYSPTLFKGAAVALRALQRIRDALPEVRVIAFGSTDLHAEVPATAWIEHTVEPSEARLRDGYAEADVWLCASTSEGFNLPALEAMACRTPVVSTRTGWPADALIDGLNGYVCPIGDDAALADRALQVLRAGPVGWTAMSTAAHRTAHAMTREQATTLFEHALRRAIARAPGLEPPASPATIDPWPVRALGAAPLTQPRKLR
jgi:glycosyltransferase involved in cell wall biosynthesis